MAVSVVTLLIYLLTIIHAAPTYSDRLITHPKNGESLHVELMEHVCNDLTFRTCLDRDGYGFRSSVFDSGSHTCVCSTSPSMFLVEQKCRDVAYPADLAVAYYWPVTDGCFCESNDFFARSWNYMSSDDAPNVLTQVTSALGNEPNDSLVQETIHDDKDEAAPARLLSSNLQYDNWLSAAYSVPKQKMEQPMTTQTMNEIDQKVYKRQDVPSATSSQAPVDTAVPTFVPPPKVDITPQLINQSLTVQPQDTATVSSVIPHLLECIITFLIQLDGIVANTIPVNASCTFPCGSIGSEPQPDIMLVPKYIQNGAQQTTLPDCRCIAVNMYDPNVITYWVQDSAGSIFSLVGSNKVSHIDEIDTGQPVALSILPSLGIYTNRKAAESVRATNIPRRQVLKTAVCDRRCPGGSEPVPGDLLKNPPECGCLLNSTTESFNLIQRGLTAPGPYTATMTKQVCEAMKCINNGDAPAMFNPFSLTCWCADPTYMDDNASAWSPGSAATM